MVARNMRIYGDAHARNCLFIRRMAAIAFDLWWAVPYNRHCRMHILMIAPEPFFEPRGTPFSEYHRIRALLDLGHTVDLVTYPFGKDVDMNGLRIFRARRPPFIKAVN